MPDSEHQGRVLFIVGLDFSCSIEEKQLVWLIDIFNRLQTKLKQLKKHLRDYVWWL